MSKYDTLTKVAEEYTKALVAGNSNRRTQAIGNLLIDNHPGVFLAAEYAADVIKTESKLSEDGFNTIEAHDDEMKEIASKIGLGLCQNEYGNPVDARCLATCLDVNKQITPEGDTLFGAAYYAEILVSRAPRSDNWHELGQAMALQDLEKLIEDPGYQPENISPESLASTHEAEREAEEEFGMSM